MIKFTAHTIAVDNTTAEKLIKSKTANSVANDSADRYNKSSEKP
mgnify:CR=1 FL=1